ncbi:reverse transcriptase domain-containing protein [Lacticaseibacillus zhaodongensis]|uniref:reverse transcriptase domain-containing protein n=1 Tax=Lacticaseibacillus zhaodongensis TaxID=2668065 RepID=UPI0018AFBC49|nr:reverse transcriptase domain-containing protein [Lacticaseibacillus zhaodongensis]
MDPKAYIYLTYQTFMLAFKLFKTSSSSSILDFSTTNVKVYYAGRLDFSGKNLSRNAIYKDSYRAFQHERAKYRGSRVLKLDIQNFFIGITRNRLREQVQEICTNKGIMLPDELTNILEFMNASDYSNLPQSQSSTATSVLSQIYLVQFTDFLEKIAKKDKLKIVRYVDDMYIKLPEHFSDSNVNSLIEQISSKLWAFGLNLNASKIQLFSVDKYNKSTDWNSKAPVSGINIPVPEYVDSKIESILLNDGQALLEYFKMVLDLYHCHGYDMQRYASLTQAAFSVANDNVNKIQNALIFGYTWKNRLSDSTKVKIDSMAPVIGFDPAKYVTFFLMIERNLRLSKNHITVNGVEKFISTEHLQLNDQPYTIRNGITDSHFFIQKRQFIDDSNQKILRVNKGYMQFIYHFVLPLSRLATKNNNV